MLKIKEVSDKHGEGIPMNKMQPLQIAVIIDRDYPEYFGHYVLRTASKDTFEVVDLSVWEPNYCWTDNDADLRVKLLERDKKLVIEISNAND